MTRRLLCIPLLALTLLLAAGCGSEQSSDEVSVDGRIGEVRLPDATASDPYALDPTATTVLSLTIINDGEAPVTIEHIRLEGEMLGLTFLTYDVRVQIVVPAGGTRFVEVPLDFFDLDEQAHGYLRTYVRLYDADRELVASEQLAIDVRGNVGSSMVIFAVALLVITVGSLAFSLRDLARRSLPEHRFARGMRFLVPGLGLGLLLSSAASILRIYPLPATSWAVLTLIPTAAGFAIGYFLTPAPLHAEDEDELDESELVDEVPV